MITAKVDPIDRDIRTMIDDTLSVAAQISQFAEFAIESELAALLIDETILDRIVTVKKWVDGVLDASEYAVKLHGTIVYEFGLGIDVIEFIGEELQKNSPVGSGFDKHPGLYKSSHVLFADGIEVAHGARIPQASEYTFVNTLPYSIKIESGQSSQAPSGVYELTAFQAQQKYGNIAKIQFIDYVGVFGVMAQSPNATYGRHTRLQHNKAVNRYPAIRVTM